MLDYNFMFVSCFFISITFTIQRKCSLAEDDYLRQGEAVVLVLWPFLICCATFWFTRQTHAARWRSQAGATLELALRQTVVGNISTIRRLVNLIRVGLQHSIVTMILEIEIIMWHLVLSTSGLCPCSNTMTSLRAYYGVRFWSRKYVMAISTYDRTNFQTFCITNPL